jgi:2-amino-4-hydroxy-6-hydroxymethyldihydropteridine diphosphokinase
VREVEPREVVLGLGSNLGGREALLRAARALLGARCEARDVRASSVYETLPLGPPQPGYLNAAVALRTALPLDAVLSRCRAVEDALGRARGARWGPRTLDVDVLWSDGAVVRGPSLTVPHPGLRARAFALEPLLELCPGAVDPTDGAALAWVLRDAAGIVARAPWSERFPTEEQCHTADEGFVTRARDRADLLSAACEALGALIVEPDSVRAEAVVPLAVAVDADAEDDERLFAWLAEALHALDAGRLALARCAVLEDGPGAVRGVLLGEPLDEARHRVRGAVKAITFHGLEARRSPEGGWLARVIVDV